MHAKKTCDHNNYNYYADDVKNIHCFALMTNNADVF